MSPALRVHTWGGYGSQLFTAYLLLKLKRRFPNRRIKAINHTSGVTRRVTEFNFDSIGVKVVQAEDFETAKLSKDLLDTSPKFPQSFRVWARWRAIQTLKKSKIVVDSNNDKSFDSIKPWTIAIRGHYTNLKIQKEFVVELYRSILGSRMHSEMQTSKIVIHYRLGDLISLKQKSPVNPEKIDAILSSVLSDGQSPLLLTDSSISEFSTFVLNTRFLKECQPQTLNPQETLLKCIEADILIGSSSKLSLWGAIFRQFIHKKNSYLPKDLDWAAKNGLNATWY
jgi:hypothetical protein